MLQSIHLENVVLFADATLEFCPGLNVISGETGAGKSLLAQALSLALGKRAGADQVREGADRAVVTAAFVLTRNQAAQCLTASRPAPAGEDAGLAQIVFKRTLPQTGRGRLTVNGRSRSAGEVRDMALCLIDVAAQHEQTRLADPGYQRELIDRYGKTTRQAKTFGEAFSSASALQQRLLADDAERDRAARRLQTVRDDLALIEAAGYTEEDSRLEDRIRALTNVEEIRLTAEEGLSLLYEGDDALQDQVADLLRKAEALSDCCPPLQEAANALVQVTSGFEEAVRSYREALETVQAPPDELDRAIERAESLKRLARRLGCEVAQIPEQRAKLQAEAETLAAWECDTENIQELLTERLGALAKAGLSLRTARARAAKRLAKAVSQELAELDMQAAGFAAEITPLWQRGDPPEEILCRGSAQGLEEVSFLLSPNPGEPATPLCHTASGGEMARALLAIKSALSAVYHPPVLFFDEIDTGIGGRLGETVARKLKSLSSSRQVIAITHLPQIAARADTHLLVTKDVTDGRTLARVQSLSGQARTEEIAQMIHGKASTATTRKQAIEMLADTARK